MESVSVTVRAWRETTAWWNFGHHSGEQSRLGATVVNGPCVCFFASGAGSVAGK